MNSQSTKTILVADIFGLTDELIELSEAIGGNAIILEPYDGEKNLFSSEKSAYQFFTNEVGLEKYAGHVLNEISKYNKVRLIGFSVGAAAIWSCSTKLKKTQVKHAYCFYGSQIRNLMHTTPNFPVNVVLPKYEEHFSIQKMDELFQRMENITIQRSDFLHGFMNKRSCNFNQAEYNRYIIKLRQQTI